MWFSDILFPGSGNPASGTGGGWLGAFLGSGYGRAATGATVTPQTALALTAVQRAVTLLAESVAKLPAGIFRHAPDGSKEPLADHPLLPILRTAPNAFQTPYQFREFLQTQLGLRGNAFALKFRNPDGTIKSLYPINSDRVIVYVSPIDRLPYYRILRAPDGIEGMYAMGDIHHVRWISDNAYTGLSPIALHREAIGVAMAGERHTGRVFGNGTNLTGTLTRPATAPPIKDPAMIERITRNWEEKYAGADNAGRVALLQEGMAFTPLSMSNADAQLIEQRRYSAGDIARIYGIPPHMLGDLNRATNANIEQQSLEFLTHTLMSWIKRHEEAMERDLLLPQEREDGIVIRLDVRELLRGDLSSRYAAYAMGRQWGWLSINDIRRAEGMPSIERGDAYLQPLNMADATQPAPAPARTPGAPSTTAPRTLHDMTETQDA